MPVKKDASGRRSVQAEVEVPGTPEEVWQAIATGPGISSWFVPTEVDGRVGGAVVSHFGPGNSMDSVATITAWEPPRRFVAEDRGRPGSASPPSGSSRRAPAAPASCASSTAGSPAPTTGTTSSRVTSMAGRAFFRILRLYLTHFRGAAGAAFQLMGVAPEPKEEAWEALTGPLGFAGAAQGERVTAGAGAPPLAGLVERDGPSEHPEGLLLRLDEPAPGLAHFFALPMGGNVYVIVRFYLFGCRRRRRCRA